MDIMASALLQGQPTLTNPLNQQGLLEGRKTVSQTINEAENTVLKKEQLSTSLSNAQVVNQAEESQELNSVADDSPGKIIDVTV